jgi:hypothetical protein
MTNLDQEILPGCYYKVDNKIFSSKINAILEAQKTLADVSWNFYNHVFDNIDWTKEPVLSLDQLYKLRAQQIRDQYDYVIVMCSGGADSTNVVKSFLENNIHVDEIVAGAPMSGLNNWNWNDKDTSVNNTISETRYALFPLLNEISVKYPNVKITFNDYFENIINYKTDEWLYDCQDWINPVVNAKGRLDKFKHISNLAEQGKRIGVVWGIDKPMLRYDQAGNIYSIITDSGVNVADAPFDKNYPNVDRVLFYWAHDLPELLVKQSHVVAKFAHKKENLWLTDLIKGVGLGSPEFWKPRPTDNFTKNDYSKNDYQRGIVPIIYGDRVEKVFQCQKSNVMFMPLQHDWFYTLHKDTPIHQMISSDFNLFYKNINKRYLNYRGVGFISFLQKYKIGHYKEFMS